MSRQNSLLIAAKLNALNTLIRLIDSKLDTERERSGGLLEKELVEHYRKLTYYSEVLEATLKQIEHSVGNSQ